MVKETRNLKVLHIASGDLWAGAEVQLFTLAKALHAIPGIVVEVILLNHGKLEQKLRNTGIDVTVVDETQLNGVKILFRLISILRETAPDVIHTHRLKENILGSIAAYLSGSIPSLRTVHGAPEHPPSWKQLPKRLIHWLDLLCGRFLQQKIISVSADLSKILKKDLPPEKICIIENGIDLLNIKHSPRSKNIHNTFKVGIAGRLVPVKRIDIFIKTARYILDHYPDLKIEFHIFGDGPLRSSLEQLSRELGTETIVFFEGHSDNVHKKLEELDALLMTSDHEGLPMVLLEAMALEIPIIAHAVGGIPHLLDHGTCGFLVNDNNEQSFSSAINKVINSSEKVSEITQNASRRVKENYSAEKNAQACYSQYLSILE